MKKFIDWIVDHDNKKLFIIVYIGVSLVLSIAISLFWLLFAVMMHFLFEVIGQSRKQKGTRKIFLESLWETKLDFALVMFALWLAVYLDFIFGVAGIGAAARVGAQTASRAGSIGSKAAEVTVRAATWNRVIRAIMLSLDDVGNAVKAIYQSKKAKKQKEANKNLIAATSDNTAETNAAKENSVSGKSSWLSKWSAIDYIGVGLFALCAITVILSPQLISMSFSEIINITFEEFHPWPG